MQFPANWSFGLQFRRVLQIGEHSSSFFTHYTTVDATRYIVWQGHSITLVTRGPHRLASFFERVSTLSSSHIARLTDIPFFCWPSSTKVSRAVSSTVLKGTPFSYPFRLLRCSLRIPLGARCRCVHHRRYLISRPRKCCMYPLFICVPQDRSLTVLITFQVIIVLNCGGHDAKNRGTSRYMVVCQWCLA